MSDLLSEHGVDQLRDNNAKKRWEYNLNPMYSSIRAQIARTRRQRGAAGYWMLLSAMLEERLVDIAAAAKLLSAGALGNPHYIIEHEFRQN